MSLVMQNNNKIVRGFTNATVRVMTCLKNGMEELLDWGMEECLNAHDEEHRNHFDMGDGYGWILYYNRQEISKRIYEGAYGENVPTAIKSVEIALREFQVEDDGWVGVIMASMQPRTYFVKRKEIEFMQIAIKNIKGRNFKDVFVAV